MTFGGIYGVKGFKLFLKETWGLEVTDISEEIVPKNHLKGTVVESSGTQFGYFTVIGQP
jgi:hypothetical protein